MAEIHRSVGNYEERRKSLLEATRVKPDDLDLLFQIARIEESENDWERALKTLEGAAKLDKSTRSKEKMARLHLNYGDSEKGYGILYELAGSENSDWQSTEAIADAMIGQQDWERAVEFLQPQMERFPDNYRLGYLYGLALEETGATSLAAEQFLELLDDEKEIPGRKQTMTANSPFSAGYMKQMLAVMPKETADYMMMMYQSRQVYQYRQPQRMARSRGISQTNIAMPPNVEAVRSYALAHLLEIGRTGLDDAELESLDKKAVRKGVANLHVLRRVIPTLQTRYQIDPSLIEEFPEEKGLLAMWVVTSMNNNNLGAETSGQIAEKAIKVFKETHPQLAAMAGLTAVRTDEKLVKPTLDLLKEVKQPSNYLLSALIQSTTMANRTATEESSAFKEELTKRMIAWYPKAQAGYQSVQLFSLIISKLQADKDPTAYLKFLDDEIVRHRSASASTANMASRMFGHRQQANLLQPLVFPPMQLSGYPEHVLAMTLSANGSMNSPAQAMAAQIRAMSGQPAFQGEENVTVESLKLIKDPVLRLLYANKLEQKELVEASFKKLVEAEQPKIESFLLAAAFAQSNDKPAEAIRLLERGRHLPMKRETRKTVDSAIVSSALEIEELSEEQKQIGVDAALRLRVAKLQPQERQQLIPALASLGLEKEADKLEAQQAKLANSRASSGMFGSPYGGGFQVSQGRPTRTATSNIKKLLDGGKKDQAVRALATQLTSMGINSGISHVMMGRRGGNAIDPATKNLIKRYKLKDDILKRLEPGERSSGGKVTNYATACSLLGEEAKGRKALEDYLEKRPKDSQTRLQIMLMTKDPDKLLEYAKGIDRRSLPMIGSFLQQLMRNSEMDVSKRLNIADGIGKHIAQMEQIEKTDLSWLAQVTQQLGQYVNTRGGNFYPLYYTNMQHNRVSQKAAELRRRVHDNLCRTLLKHPETTEQAFALLLAANEVEKVGDDDFVELAKQSIAIAKKPRVANMQQNFRFHSGNSRQVPFRKPAEYLVRQAKEDGNLDYVRNELIPMLSKAGRSDSVSAVESYLKLLTCDEKDYLEFGRAYAKKEARANPSPYGSSMSYQKVLEVWVDRKLDVDIGSLLLNDLKVTLRGNQNYGAPTLVTAYANELADRNGNTNQLLEDLAELYLGPKSKRVEFIQEHLQQNHMSPGTPNAKIQGFQQMLQQLSQNENLVLPVALMSVELGIERNTGASHQLGRTLFANPKDVKAKKMLKDTAFVKDLGEFRAYVNRSSQTAWGQALQNLYGADAKVKQEFTSENPDTFGWNLLQAVASEKPQPALVALFKKYRPQIEKLQKSQQNEISLLSKQLMQRFSEWNDEDKELREWLASMEVVEQDGFAATILKAKRLQNIKSIQDEDQLRQKMKALIKADRKQAKAVFFKLVKLLEPLAISQNSPYGGGFGGGGFMSFLHFHDPSTSIGSQLLHTILEDYGRSDSSESRAKEIAFALEVLHSAKPEIEINGQLRYSLRNTMDRFRRGRNSVETSKETYALLGKELGDIPSSLLLDSFRSGIQSLNDKDRKTLMEWAESETQAESFPKLATELLAAIRLQQARNEFSKKKAEDKKLAPVSYAHHIATFEDDSLPVTWREHIAAGVLQRNSTELDDVVLASAKLLCSKKDVIHPTDFAQQTFRRLLQLDRTSEQWKVAAKELADTWNDKLMRPKGQLAKLSQRNGGNSPYVQEQILLPLMALNVELGQTNEFTKLSRRFAQNVSHSNEFIALLIRYDKPQEAKTAFKLKVQNNNLRTGYSGIFRYDEELEKRIPAFLELLADTDERYIAEILLSSMLDPQTTPNRSSASKDSPRAKRLANVSHKFGELKFLSDEMKTKALVLLVTSDRDCVLREPAIRDEIKQLVSSYDIYDAIDRRNYALNSERQAIYKAHLNAAFEKENVADPFVKLMDELAEVETDEMHMRSQFIRTLTQPVTELMRKRKFAGWKQEELAKLAAAFRKLETSDESLLRYLHDISNTSAALHIMAGEHEAFEKAHKEYKSKEQSARRNRRQFYMQQLPFLQNHGDTEKLPIETRIRMVGSLVRVLSALEQINVRAQGDRSTVSVKNSNSLAQALAGPKIFTNKELIEHAAELAKVDGGYAWASVACIHDSRKSNRRPSKNKTAEKPADVEATKSSEKSVDAWKKAIAAARNADSRMEFRLGLARLYKRLNRIDDAKQVIVEQEDVSKTLKRDVDRFLNSLPKS